MALFNTHCRKIFFLKTAFMAFVILGFSNSEAAFLKVPRDYSTIQNAIDAAHSGDTVQVGQGTYNETINLKTNVKVEGGWNPEYGARNWNVWTSIIDGSGRGPVVEGAEGATIDGFTIRNGNARLGAGIRVGEGGMLIKHNTIINNTATGGGAGIEIHAVPSGAADIEITYNIIQDNQTDGKGAGIYVSNSYGWIHITNNTIGGRGHGNTADEFGGGILVEACPMVNIQRNEITYNDGGVYAGGIHLSSGGTGTHEVSGTSNSMISDNIIQYNHANLGGAGIHITGGCMVNRNHIAGNHTDHVPDAKGGGIWLGSLDRYDSKVENNFIYGNIAGTTGGDGIYLSSGINTRIINNTIAGNGIITERRNGKGLYIEGEFRGFIKNNIIWDNRDDFYEASPSCVVAYNDIGSGGLAGADGNIMADPVFVSANDLHIQASSPCKNAGTSSDAPGDDIDQDSRGSRTDIGADEQVPLTTVFGLVFIGFGLLISGVRSFRKY